MKLIIAGGRDFKPLFHHWSWLYELHSQFPVSEVVSGTARGADRFGEAWATSLAIPVKRFPADWDTHGRAAGAIRNGEMAAYADAAALFLGGAGTRDMFSKALSAGITIWDWRERG